MSWDKIALGSIAEFKNGINFDKSSFGTGIKVINVSAFKDRLIPDYKSLPEINPDGLIKHSDILQNFDILFVRSNGNKDLVGRSMFIDDIQEQITFSGFCIRCRFIAKDIYPLFYAYLFKGQVIRNELSNSSNGTNITNLNQTLLNNLGVPKPQYNTQKRIAGILSTYDNLIEINLKRIMLLEETAQNVYKEWFVNFRFANYEHTEFDKESGLPVGWKLDIIGNQLLSIKRNGKLKTDEYEVKGKFPIIDQGNGFIAGYTNNEELVQDSNLPMVVFGDHTRRVKFVNFPFVSGADGTQLMFPKNELLLPAYFYLSINNIDLSNYAYARHYKFMKEQSIIIPDEKILNEFNQKVYPFLEQTIQLFNYNQKLKEARDILLPRLMNRTIEV